ncbi:hypothetical protein ASA1KI_42660 [Opitutales bacterium ASA1]|nr:hypothetical protein ASA1KI_42660 [Opitutales bacterium ASA1]
MRNGRTVIAEGDTVGRSDCERRSRYRGPQRGHRRTVGTKCHCERLCRNGRAVGQCAMRNGRTVIAEGDTVGLSDCERRSRYRGPQSGHSRTVGTKCHCERLCRYGRTVGQCAMRNVRTVAPWARSATVGREATTAGRNAATVL